MAKNYILLGPPGSGKSTQAELMVNYLHAAHIDMGASLRNASMKDSDFSRALYDVLNVRKALVSNDIIERVLNHDLERIDADTHIVLDGAPRREDQIPSVESLFARYHRSVDKVIYLYLPEDISIKRIASRFSCMQCKKPAIVNDETMRMRLNAVCESCGGFLEQRADDTPGGVRTRLAVFARETLPVIEYYRSRGKLLQIDGTKEAEEIFTDILKGLVV